MRTHRNWSHACALSRMHAMVNMNACYRECETAVWRPGHRHVHTARCKQQPPCVVIRLLRSPERPASTCGCHDPTQRCHQVTTWASCRRTTSIHHAHTARVHSANPHAPWMHRTDHSTHHTTFTVRTWTCSHGQQRRPCPSPPHSPCAEANRYNTSRQQAHTHIPHTCIRVHL